MLSSLKFDDKKWAFNDFRLRSNYVIWGWLMFFLLFNGYCFFWRQSVLGTTYNFIDSQWWYAKEWGAVMLLTPIILKYMDLVKRQSQGLLGYLLGGTLFVSLTVILRLAINTGEYGDSWFTAAVIVLPKYTVAVGLLFLFWQRLQLDDVVTQQSQNKIASHKVLEITHNGMKKTIVSASVSFIKAAGNYVEIESDGHTYLHRMTLSEMASAWACEGFIKIHRSYLVNKNSVVGLVNTENGGASVKLNSGLLLPVSKKFKPEVKASWL